MQSTSAPSIPLSITSFWGCYKTKASAARAMHRLAGQQIQINYPGISTRFEAVATLRAEMLAVTQLQGGWGVACKYTPDDLTVSILGKDGMAENVPYSTVAHWQDASHPEAEA